MVKNLFPLSMALILAITGCGSDSDSKNDPGSSTVTFDTQGTYDLKDYLYPTSDAEKYSDVWIYDSEIDSSISKYAAQRLEYTSMQQSGELTYTVTILDYIGDYEPETAIIDETKITSYDEDNESTEMARHVDTGDLIVSENSSGSGTTNNDTSYTWNATEQCSVISHHDSITLTPDDNATTYTYSDVLKITCTYEGALFYDTSTTPVDSTYDSWDVYFAKSQGMVAKIDNDCYDEEDNLKDNLTTCTSIYKEYSYLNLEDSLFNQ